MTGPTLFGILEIKSLTSAETIVSDISKFSDESISESSDYDLNVQRIYFLDEVHRSYNPKGSFLANLISSDRNAVIIGLTGTPLIYGDFKSKEIFGDYIHKYYYNKSIKDGYTLRLIREGIETNFQKKMNNLLNDIKTKKGTIKKKELYSKPKFVKPLTKYIIDDFKKSRMIHDDPTIGGMIVCDSSEQAKEIFNQLEKIDNTISAALILHDVDTKELRRDKRIDFKQGKIDFLVVYAMLLTGFDAKRLKKMYLSRIVRKHNLLQTLTRVNRPYKKFRYGYVVDFADIRHEFDETNKEYFKELSSELGDEVKNYSDFFKTSEEIHEEIKEIKENLFHYDFSNLEEFQKIISKISDKKELLELKKNLNSLKEIYNLIKLENHKELKEKFSFDIVNKLFNEVSNRINIINLKNNLENEDFSSQLLNIALEDMEFTFRKISEHEMIIADEFRDRLEKARHELKANFDNKDPQYLSLFEELKRLFKKKNIEELTSTEMKKAVDELQKIYREARKLNTKDEQLSTKYEHDRKYAKIHKRIKESKMSFLKTDTLIHKILLQIKHNTDIKVLDNHDMIHNNDYFSEMTKSTIMETLEKEGIKDLDTVHFINNILINEYVEEMVA